MRTTGTLYEDLGGDYYKKLNPERTLPRAIRQLEAMGYRVNSTTLHDPRNTLTRSLTWLG